LARGKKYKRGKCFIAKDKGAPVSATGGITGGEVRGGIRGEPGCWGGKGEGKPARKGRESVLNDQSSMGEKGTISPNNEEEKIEIGRVHDEVHLEGTKNLVGPL